MARPRGLTRLRRPIAVGAVLLALVGCSATVDGSGSRENRPTSPRIIRSPAASTAAPAPAPGSGPAGSGPAGSAPCPATYRAPDPDRPRAQLAFVVSDDHTTVTGTETVVFRPDLPITELVFRLTANTRPTVAQGNKIVVTSATASPGGGRYGFTLANAAPSTQGGLLRIPLATPVPAGGRVSARLAFTLTLGQDSFDRFGRVGDFAYFGSAQPLLAWERGYGWHTEDMIDFTAESATSEAMDTDLTVTAPAGDTVIASGNPADPPAGSGRPRVWRSHLDAARDVSVAVGPFAVSDTVVAGTKLRVGAYSTALRDTLVPEFRRAIVELSAIFGPFPYPSLAVARVPAGGGGIEYPGSILMLDSSRLVSVHETAHQWFYAMIGDSQSQHPWLDEAFATYAQERVDGAPDHRQDLQAPNDVDRSVQSYGSDVSGYYFTTYNKGAAALEAARRAAGAARWDAALRCYVANNAWRIVTPADFHAAIADLPGAVGVLRRAGALR